MAPNKKKKKPAGNPARGFATTSIASKPKPEKVVATKEEEAVTEDRPVEADAVPGPPPSSEPVPSKPDPTPEELEAQLEAAEKKTVEKKVAEAVENFRASE